MIGDDETNFPHKRQVANLRKAFSNHSSTNIKLSKTKLSKMVQSGGFLGRLRSPLLKTRLPLISNVFKPLAKSVLVPLGLTAAASAASAEIHTKILGSGNMTTLIISNGEIEDIIKTGKSLEYSGLLLKRITETIRNKIKKQKIGFLSMLLGTLCASLLGNLRGQIEE